jgi:hypothetical protein
MIKSDLKGAKKELLEICYHAIKIANSNLIKKAKHKNQDIDETADVPTLVHTVLVNHSSISDTVHVNNKLCTALDIF